MTISAEEFNFPEIDEKIKVLVSSGYNLNGEATEVLQQGANDFIRKRSKKLLSRKFLVCPINKGENFSNNDIG